MKIEQKVPLKNFTTLHIGGPADFFVRVKNPAELKKAWAFARRKKLPVFFLGGGSNVLFAERGFRGLVIKNEIGGLKFKKKSVTVGSGETLITLIQKSAAKKLAGVENLAGIPGTVGGAIAGNAGVQGTEIGCFVKKATLLTRTGKIKTITPKYFRFRYRSSRLKRPGDFLVNVTLKLKPSTENLPKKITEFLRIRSGKQPQGFSAGSCFKNPRGRKAWELIEKAGLRGATVGGAKVSEKHANWLVSDGHATATDFYKLIKLIRKKVYEKYGVRLQLEIVVVKPKP